MSLSSTTNRVQYTGDGATTVFAYTFKIYAAGDLKVYVDSATGVAELKTNGVDYTLSGVGDDAGGNITFTTAPTNARKVTAKRELPLTQLVTWPANDKFPSTSHAEAADRLVMIVQALDEIIDRCPRLPVNSSLSEIEFPEGTSASNRALKSFRWNSAGTGLELFTLVSSGTYVDPVVSTGQMIRGGDTGAQEAFNVGAVGALLQVSGSPAKPNWLAPGANTNFLGIASSVPTWRTAAQVRTDIDVPTNAQAVLQTLADARGDIIVATAADTWARKALGAKGALLASDGTDPQWHAVGTNAFALVADSAQANGIKWYDYIGSDETGVGSRTFAANKGIFDAATSSTFAFGTGTARFKPRGVLDVNTTQQATTGTVKETLASYTLPANSLSANGKALHVTAWFTLASNANSKTATIDFGGTEVAKWDGATTATYTFKLEVLVVRTGASAQRYVSEASLRAAASGNSGTGVGGTGGTLTVTDTGTITIAATATTPGAAGDVTFNGMIVEALN